MLVEAMMVMIAALGVPPGFVDEPVATGFEEATGLTFDDDGRMFVWEKAGRVHIVENGVRLPTPLIDLRQEVNPWRDFGLLGFALDPHFHENGYVYLLYTVDYHHVQFFGTPQYNPATNNIFVNTIGRLTRYTARASDGLRTVDPATRLVLIGETRQTGLPVCHQSHSVGSLAFAQDGTLLLSNGDGASYETSDDGGPISGASNTALAEGIITPTEDVGAYRAQLINSMSGKILRVDPATGDGIASNPYFDAAAPRAPRSRVWSLGLRNPFRFSIKPGSGSTLAADGNPGECWIGDVGWNTREELNVARGPGVNFGWPHYEGLTPQFDYDFAPAFNRDAPNPLFGIGACTQPFLGFRDLLVQATLNPPSWPNPCNTSVQIPAALQTFMHTRPVLDWRHGTGPARTGTFAGGIATTSTLGTPGCPVAGVSFGGNSATGGVWYTASHFPAPYQGTYFFADFVAGWLRVLRVGPTGEPQSVELFSDDVGSAVCFAVNPADGMLYYVNYDEQGQAVVRRIRRSVDLPPVVQASAAPPFGPLPLSVGFSALGTTDPEGLGLVYTWDFGDGSPTASGITFNHTYSGQRDITPQGTIIARVLGLSPPGPTGGGNPDPEIIRDGDRPPVGSDESSRQFDTFHSGDQGTDDWLGYEFTTPWRFDELQLQEGRHFVNGGWWTDLRVEYRSAGVWSSVAGLSITPAYSGNNGVSFESFRLTFTQTPPAEAIRIRGTPGGSAGFVSVAELRAIAEPALPSTTPQRFDATLTVVDAGGNTVTRSFLISANNTPRGISITAPLDGQTYAMPGPAFFQPLLATIEDDEHSPAELACAWQTILHHNEHNHPETPDPLCATQSLITPLGCDGETYFFEFRLTVTDAAGLSTVQSSFIYPRCCSVDFNNDGFVEPGDLDEFITAYFSDDPAERERTDFNNDGLVEPGDLDEFITAYFDGC
ncbi:MAG: PQQ-dependent sugar dehydrogenase [Phycisphaerales bacterium]